MFALVQNLKQTTNLRWNRVHKFKNKVDLCIEMGPFILKTAQNQRELLACFQLRHDVFNVEFKGASAGGLDFDRFDYYFDHLIILHRESDKVVGTYRLSSSKFSKESYTALEFDISSLTQVGHYLELGRACIDKDFRRGTVIALLWRGIVEYMNLCSANILFGCSSVKVSNARDAALLYRYFENCGYLSRDFKCEPTADFKMKYFDVWDRFFENGMSERQRQEAEELVPPLIRSYIRQGARIVCEPAFDRDFNCIDFLTALRREDLSNSLAQRLQVVR